MQFTIGQHGRFLYTNSYRVVLEQAEMGGPEFKGARDLDSFTAIMEPGEVPLRIGFNAGIGVVEAAGIVQGKFRTDLLEKVAPKAYAAGFWKNPRLSDYPAGLRENMYHSPYTDAWERIMESTKESQHRERIAFIGTNLNAPEFQPCTASIQLKRTGRVGVVLHVYMRSLDLHLGFPTDCMIWHGLMRHWYGDRYKKLYFHVACPHVYVKNLHLTEKVREGSYQYDFPQDWILPSNNGWMTRTPLWKRRPAFILAEKREA